ncbi:PKD domain-containing protein [Paenarthrobacter sp. Z7-10]|uniref:PKD domain-containing protein n=1 Tax=Paenarthrobacter sp. Z7-10 TaxID=2787635 RepID=UPI0022A8E281|nr:PKD domain-containing protein [Paenarthrobacter sp. Z7-10]
MANKYGLPSPSENTDQVVGDIYNVTYCKAASTQDVQACLAPSSPPPVNQPPVAAITSSNTGLDVAVDGSRSTDSDGTIGAYAWTFGDGASANGPTTGHTYAAAGTYTMTLTVTDDVGATGTATKTVSVTAEAGTSPGVVFRAAAQTNVNSTSPTVTEPDTVQAGDGILLFATINTTSPVAGPPSGSGWRLVGSRAGGTMQTLLWAKTAQATDTGSPITVPLTSIAKTALQMVAYSGVTGPNWIDSAVSEIQLTSSNTRSTPAVTIGTPASTLVSYWANKSSVDNGWTADARVLERSQTTGTGGGRITSLLGDSGPLDPGSSGKFAATPLVVPDSKCAVWSVVLTPGS